MHKTCRNRIEMLISTYPKCNIYLQLLYYDLHAADVWGDATNTSCQKAILHLKTQHSFIHITIIFQPMQFKYFLNANNLEYPMTQPKTYNYFARQTKVSGFPPPCVRLCVGLSRTAGRCRRSHPQRVLLEKDSIHTAGTDNYITLTKVLSFCDCWYGRTKSE